MLTLFSKRSRPLIFIVGIGVVATIGAVITSLSYPPSSSSDPGSLPVALASETKPLPSWRLRIPSIELNAPVQAVGLTREGNMGIPSDIHEAGWLKTGPKPGRPGNAVITGHISVDSRTPGVFQYLYKLKVGDSVYVTVDHKELEFKVIDTKSYQTKRAPLEKIVGATSETHLNLITCHGTWDKAKQEYDRRLVVFTELVS